MLIYNTIIVVAGTVAIMAAVCLVTKYLDGPQDNYRGSWWS